MTTIATPVKKEQTNGISPENKKGVENHKVAARHHEEAAKNHHEAAKHHEDGNHEKAAQSTIIANGHSSLAHEAQKEDAKHHAAAAKK
jgi:hypothetical protein